MYKVIYLYYVYSAIQHLPGLPVVRGDTVEMSAWGVAALAGIQVIRQLSLYTGVSMFLPTQNFIMSKNSKEKSPDLVIP